jgi:hypothetical protein
MDKEETVKNQDEEEIVLEKSKSDKDEEEQVHDQNTESVEGQKNS